MYGGSCWVGFRGLQRCQLYMANMLEQEVLRASGAGRVHCKLVAEGRQHISLWQGVVWDPIVDRARGASCGPDDVDGDLGMHSCQLHQLAQRCDSRVARANNKGLLAQILGRLRQHVGNQPFDAVRASALSHCREAPHSQVVAVSVGPRGVDHHVSLHNFLTATTLGQEHSEPLCCAQGRPEVSLEEMASTDGHHRSREQDLAVATCLEVCRKRLQVRLDKLKARWVRGWIRHLSKRLGPQRRHVQLPRREEPHMPPTSNISRHLGSCLHHGNIEFPRMHSLEGHFNPRRPRTDDEKPSHVCTSAHPGP
mmetsp:Transcript_730/g.2341  ORF Transcript_730/g.2341 Transcript_730/m.2341 type:complete len:309 (-) Transcript_730:77-1003(-)